MSASYDIDPSARRVTVTFGTTAPGYREWERLTVRILDDSEYQAGFDVLVDARRTPAPDAPCVRRMVTFLRHHAHRFAGSRWAVVVKDRAAYGMARMGQGLAGDDLPESELFWSEDEAQAWLDEGRARRFG